MRATIRRVKASFSWSRRFGALLGGSPPPDAPLAFLARRLEYKQFFARLQADAAVAITPPGGGPPLELPWPRRGTNRFWRCYVAPAQLAEVTGGVAWSQLVPLRWHATHVPTAEVLPVAGVEVRVEAAEALFHPHSITFALHATATADEPVPLAEMVKALVALRNGKVLAEIGKTPARADDLAASHLDELCREALGSLATAALPAAPYSLVTVLQGDGVDPADPINEGIQRALEAMARWSPTWDANPLPPLDNSRIPTRRAPAGHVVYGRDRSRVVWEPSFFRPSSDGGATLSCYHRNLFAGMIQTEALLAFAHLTDLAAKSGPLSAIQNEVARPVVVQLVALHTGDRTKPTYRSDGLRIQIDQHPWRSSVDAVAQRFWMDERLPPLGAAAGAGQEATGTTRS